MNKLKEAAIIGLGAATITGAGSCTKTKIVEVPGQDIHHYDTTYVPVPTYIYGNDTLLTSSGGDSSWAIGKSKYCLARNYAVLQGDHNNTDDLDLMSHFNIVAVDPSWYPNPNVRPCLNAEVPFGTVKQGLAAGVPGFALEKAFADALDAIEASTQNAYLKDGNNNIIMINGRAAVNLSNPTVASLHNQYQADRIDAFPKGATITGVDAYLTQFPSAKANIQSAITDIKNKATSGHPIIYDVDLWGFNKDVVGTMFSTTDQLRVTVYGVTAANQPIYRDKKDALAEIALTHMPGTATINNPHRPVLNEVLYTTGLTAAGIITTAKDYVNPSWDYVKGTTGRKVVGQTNIFGMDLNNPNALTDTAALHVNNDPSLGNTQFKTAPGAENDSPFGDPRDEAPGRPYSGAKNKDGHPTIAFPGAVMPEGVPIDYQGLVKPPSKAIKK